MILTKKNIKFFVPNYQGIQGEKPHRASYRFRAHVPLRGMRPGKDGILGYVEHAKEDDIVILGKKARIQDIAYLKGKGITTVFDICDNKWKIKSGPNAQNWINKVVVPFEYMIKNSDRLSTSTPYLQNLIWLKAGRRATIIPDPTERKRKEPKFNPGDVVEVLWYGNSKHFGKINWEALVNTLKKIGKFEIHTITDRTKRWIDMYHGLINTGDIHIHEYTYNKQYQLMKECDIVFMMTSPVGFDSNEIKGKSPNRILDAIQMGKPVITNATIYSYNSFRPFVYWMLPFRKNAMTNSEGYDYTFGPDEWETAFNFVLNNKDEMTKRITEGQKYIDNFHTPEVIGRKWLDLRKDI